MLDSIAEIIQEFLRDTFNVDLGVTLLARVVQSVLIVLLLFLLRWLVLRLIDRAFRTDTHKLYVWRKATLYFLAALGMVLIGRVWLSGLDTVVAYVGIVTAGLAIALQDPIASLAGWGFILWRQPFGVGDRLRIGDITGDVIDIRLFAFQVAEAYEWEEGGDTTGSIVHFPNSVVFREPLVNMHHGYPYIWNEMPVMVTFESDWRKAKRILGDILAGAAPDVDEGIRKYEQRVERYILSHPDTEPSIHTRVADSGVVLTSRYMIEPEHRRRSENEIWEAILDGFAPHWDIDFAYPTQREYLNHLEGKRKPD